MLPAVAPQSGAKDKFYYTVEYTTINSHFKPQSINTVHRKQSIECTAIWHSPPALIWLSSYVTSNCLAVTPQSGAKQTFYCNVYYITLNSNCEVQSSSKN